MTVSSLLQHQESYEMSRMCVIHFLQYGKTKSTINELMKTNCSKRAYRQGEDLLGGLDSSLMEVILAEELP